MKILEINKFYFAKGGADKHFLDLVELLESEGHQIAVFSMKHKKNKKTEWEKYFVSTVGYTQDFSLWEKLKGIFRMFYSLEANKKINQLLNEFNPDIVHIHNIYHQIPPSILFQIKKRGIPIVMTVHDFKIVSPNYNLFHNGKDYSKACGDKFYRCFLDKCIKDSYLKSFLAMLEAYFHKILRSWKNVDFYLAPSEFVKNILIKNGISGNKIETFNHFGDFSGNHIPENSKIKEKYAIYFGRISENKGINYLLNIFGDISGIKLYLAGEKEDDINLNKSNNVSYLGYLNNIMLKKYIKDAEFVISGSKLPETFGLIALEANFAGKPFLGFNNGAYKEIIFNGKNGFLFENELEMKKGINKIMNGELTFNEKLIYENALNKYNKDKYCKKILNLFENLNEYKSKNKK